MRKHRFEISFAALLVLLFAAFCWWQTPEASRRLSRIEVDTLLRQIEPRLPMEVADKAEALARLREWGETDDGEPVYMLNLMRHYEQLKRLPGVEVIPGTPAQANAHYEAVAMPMLLKLGAYPMIGGKAVGVRGTDGRTHDSLLAVGSQPDDWTRVLVVRYPNRRAFFDLISNPAYLDVLPYKLASLKVSLVPVRAEVVVPDLRWVLGLVLLALFFAVGWRRAARRR